MKKSEFRNLIREEVRRVLKEAEMEPGAVYVVDISISRSEFDPYGEPKKVSGNPLSVAMAVKKKAQKDLLDAGYDEDDIDDEVMAFKLEEDTYYILTGEEDVTIVGRPSSAKYGKFWSSLASGDMEAAEMMFHNIEAASSKAKQI